MDLSSCALLALCLSILFFQDSHQLLKAHTGFSGKGLLASPAAYQHRRFVGNWSELIDPSSKALGKIEHSIYTWEKVVKTSANESNARKQERLDEGHQYFSPLIAAVVHAQAQARLATRVDDSSLRVQRSVWGDVLSIFGFGSSMYASHEVASLNKRVEANHKELVISRQIDNKVNQRISSWGNQLESTESDTRFFAHTGGILRSLQAHLGQVEDGIIGMRQNKVRPTLITPSEADEIAKELVAEMAAEGCEPVFSGIDIVYRAEMSHIINAQGFTLLLHVAKVRQGRTSFYKLYEAEPAVIVKDGVVLKLVPDQPFIAVQEKGTLHLPLSKEDVKHCQMSDDVWVCPDSRAVTSFPNTCVACLWFQQANCASEVCAHAWTTVRDDVLQISPSRFAVREETVVILTCGNSSTTIKTADTFEVDIDCSAVAGRAVIQQGIKDSYKSEKVNKIFTFPENNVAEAEFKKIRDTIEQVNIPPVEPLPAQVASLFTILLYAAIAIGVVLVLAGIAFLSYKVFKTVYAPEGPPEDVPAPEEAAKGKRPGLGTVLPLLEEAGLLAV